MAIDPYKIEFRDGEFLVTFQKGAIVHPELLIKAINSRKNLDEAGQQNSVWDFRVCLPSSDFGYDAMERVVNYIDNHPAATRDLRRAIVVDNGVQLGGNMNINRLTFIGCLSFLILGVTVVCTAASSPIATIKGPFEQIIGILNAPQFKAPEKRASQRNNIWQIARTLFDADALSERVVGKRWATFTAPEKSRFADIFARFLGAIYIEKMQGEHSNFMINFDKELIKGDRALVRTKVIRESLEIAIDYRMKQTNGQWKIYDVLVENGISLVSNFRVQFSSILQKESPAQLIQRLEQKLADQQQVVTCD